MCVYVTMINVIILFLKDGYLNLFLGYYFLHNSMCGFDSFSEKLQRQYEVLRMNEIKGKDWIRRDCASVNPVHVRSHDMVLQSEAQRSVYVGAGPLTSLERREAAMITEPAPTKKKEHKKPL